MMELVKDFTNQGQHVLDPFCGSGSTGIACVRSGRTFTGIELDQKFFDLSCRRISQSLTQNDMFVDIPKPKQTKLVFD